MAARALKCQKYVHYDCDIWVQSEARVFDETGGWSHSELLHSIKLRHAVDSVSQKDPPPPYHSLTCLVEGRHDKRFDAYVVAKHITKKPAYKLVFAVEVVDTSDITIKSWNAKLAVLKKSMRADPDVRVVFLLMFSPRGTQDGAQLQYVLLRHWLDAFIQNVARLPSNHVLLMIMCDQEVEATAGAAAAPPPAQSPGGSKAVTPRLLNMFGTEQEGEVTAQGVKHLERVSFIRVPHLARPVHSNNPVAFMCHPKEKQKFLVDIQSQKLVGARVNRHAQS